MALRKFDSSKMNAHVVAYKKAVVAGELSVARQTLAKWNLQTRCGVVFGK